MHEVFDRASDSAEKMTHKAWNPEAKRHEKSEHIIQEFRTSQQLCIAVTVGMMAPGTDITASRGTAFVNRGANLPSPAESRDNPLECLLLRDVRSPVYFEQVKGRGTRVLSPPTSSS